MSIVKCFFNYLTAAGDTSSDKILTDLQVAFQKVKKLFAIKMVLSVTFVYPLRALRTGMSLRWVLTT